MTAGELKEKLRYFDENLKVCTGHTEWIDGVAHPKFTEAELVIIEPDVELFDDETLEFYTEDVLYVG